MTDPTLKVANDVIGKFAAEMAELTTRIALVEMALADFDGRTTLGVRAVVKAVREALDWKPKSDTGAPSELNVSTSDGEQE